MDATCFAMDQVDRILQQGRDQRPDLDTGRMSETSISRLSGFGGFDLLESRVQHFEYTPHRHAEVVIAAYTAGRKMARCEGREFGIGAGDLLVIGPETLHAARTLDAEGWHYQAIYLTVDQIAAATGLQDLDRRMGGHRLHRAKALPFRHAIDDPLALAGILVWLFADEIPGQIRTSPAAIRLVHDLLADDPSATHTLPELAELAGLSPEHLSRRFRAAYGLSPFQFLSTARVRFAREMIAKGAPIGEAAHAAGFADQSHLNRWFKRVHGVTPGAFAQRQLRSRQPDMAPVASG